MTLLMRAFLSLTLLAFPVSAAAQYDDLEAYMAAATPEEAAARLANPKLGTSAWAIQHGTGMLHFFTAVAVTEFGACVLKQDPGICAAFLESLKSPGTYLGFAVFAEVARRTSAMAGHNNRFMGGAMGLALGMFSSELFGDLWGDPRIHNLLGNHRLLETDPKGWWKRKRELMREICMEKYCNSHWYKDRSGGFVAMLMASITGNSIIGMGVPAVLDLRARSLQRASEAARAAKNFKRANELSSKALKVVQLRKTFKNALDIRRLPNIFSAAKTIFSGAKTASMNPLVILGWAVAEDVIALGATHLYEDHLMKHWNLFHRRRSLNSAIGDLMVEGRQYPFESPRDMVVRNDILNNPGWLSAKVSEIQGHWEELRQMQYYPLAVIQNRYSEVTRAEQDLDRLTAHYAWIINGMDRNFLLNDENGEKYTPDDKDLNGYLESMFCGWDPEHGLYDPWKINGYRLPLSGEVAVRNFRLDFTGAPPEVASRVKRACSLGFDDVGIPPDTNPAVREMRKEAILKFRINMVREIVEIVGKQTLKDSIEGRQPGFTLSKAYSRAHKTVALKLSDATSLLRKDFYAKSRDAALAIFSQEPAPDAQTDSYMIKSFKSGVFPLMEQESRFWSYLSQLYEEKDSQFFIKASYSTQMKTKVLNQAKQFITNPPDFVQLRKAVEAHLEKSGALGRKGVTEMLDIAFGEVEKPKEKIDWETYAHKLQRLLLLDKRTLPDESLLK